MKRMSKCTAPQQHANLVGKADAEAEEDATSHEHAEIGSAGAEAGPDQEEQAGKDHCDLAPKAAGDDASEY